MFLFVSILFFILNFLYFSLLIFQEVFGFYLLKYGDIRIYVIVDLVLNSTNILVFVVLFVIYLIIFIFLVKVSWVCGLRIVLFLSIIFNICFFVLNLISLIERIVFHACEYKKMTVVVKYLSFGSLINMLTRKQKIQNILIFIKI